MELLAMFHEMIKSTGIANYTIGNLVMICFGAMFIYFGIKKKYEPFLLIPLGIGAILVNIPGTGLMDPNGLLWFNYMGVQNVIYPPLIFLGVGAMTDFGPLIANPVTIILGATAHIGIFIALVGAKIIGFDISQAGTIGIIGGADGPMAIYVATKLAPQILGQVAVAAYSYMALLPLIQPPLMKLLIPQKERAIVMAQMRPVSKKEKIIFPILMLVLVNSLLPPIAPLISCLMLGNLIRESGVIERIADTIGGVFLDVITVFIAVAIGSTMSAASFMNIQTLEIVVLGLVAFCTGTIGGILTGRVMCWLSNGKINPLIGSAGIAAVPMAARVSHIVGVQANRSSFLIMHAMGPNVAGVLGTAVAGGIMLTLLGVR